MVRRLIAFRRKSFDQGDHDDRSRQFQRADAPAGRHTGFRAELSYGGHLKLPELLACQQPLSDQHDEMLFIVIHQATEFWIKLVLHELRAAIRELRADDFSPAFKMLARISRIQSQLIQSWDVLSTLTPSDYMTFRHRVGHASGFQSHQYRVIEFALGNKNCALIAPHAHDAPIRTAL